jgi:ferrochelatase
MGLETNEYFGIAHDRYSHAAPQKIGVLLTNVGTPDAPTYRALKKYLKQFLKDPRVIELNKFFWGLILNLIVLPFRSGNSAKKYASVWTKDGSPLLTISKEQKAKLEKILEERYPNQIEVELGMGYGNPSIDSAIKSLISKNVDRLLVLPMFPQYASATTGSTFDGISNTLTKVRAVPELRFLTRYHDEPGYINALVESIKRVWDKDGEPDKLVISFHGIPKRYFYNGDPYHCYCRKTARLIVEQMGLSKDKYVVTFQSLFGKEEWLKPYTVEVMEQLAKEGVKKLDVICPGFSADCLETIEEIEVENKEAFIHHGGEQFRYIPALNADPLFIEFLANFVERNLFSWVNHPRESTESVAMRAKLASGS